MMIVTTVLLAMLLTLARVLKDGRDTTVAQVRTTLVYAFTLILEINVHVLWCVQ